MKLRVIAIPLLAVSLALGTSAVSITGISEFESTASTPIVSLNKADAKKIKNGLVKKGSYRYFYKNGKMVKKAWKTIKGARYYFKSNGKAATKSYKIKGKYYVFNTNGKLAKGSKTRVVTIAKVKYQVTKKGLAKSGWNQSKTSCFNANGSLFTNGFKKIGSTTYCFNSKGALIRGDGVKSVKSHAYEFLCADDNGVYDSARTKLLKSFCVPDKECGELLTLLGDPVGNKMGESACYMIDGEFVDQYMYRLKNFKLYTFQKKDGTSYFCDIEAL